MVVNDDDFVGHSKLRHPVLACKALMFSAEVWVLTTIAVKRLLYPSEIVRMYLLRLGDICPKATSVRKLN